MSVSPPPDTWPRGPAPPPVPTSPTGGSSPRRAGPEKGPRHGRSHHGPITNHVPRGQIPARQVPARADESPRRRRALRAHRHLAHAHHRRMLRRSRTGLLHQTPATAQQGNNSKHSARRSSSAPPANLLRPPTGEHDSAHHNFRVRGSDDRGMI